MLQYNKWQFWKKFFPEIFGTGSVPRFQVAISLNLFIPFYDTNDMCQHGSDFSSPQILLCVKFAVKWIMTFIEFWANYHITFFNLVLDWDKWLVLANALKTFGFLKRRVIFFTRWENISSSIIILIHGVINIPQT